MTRFHRTAAAGCVTFVLLGVTACSADPAPKPQADPTSTSPSPAPSTSTSPSPTLPAWQFKYTASQIAQYNEALATWNAYQKESAPLWAAGKVTPKASQVFTRYWYTPQLPMNQLEGAQAVGAKVTGEERTLSSRPTLIQPGVVLIKQCIDASQGVVTIMGKVQPAARHPYQRVLEVDQSSRAPWRILKLKDPSTGWVKKCGG